MAAAAEEFVGGEVVGGGFEIAVVEMLDFLDGLFGFGGVISLWWVLLGMGVGDRDG